MLCAFPPGCLVFPFQLDLERYFLWVKSLLVNSFVRNFAEDPSPVIQMDGSHMHPYFECFFSMGTNLTVTSVVQQVLFNSVELNGVSQSCWRSVSTKCSSNHSRNYM